MVSRSNSWNMCESLYSCRVTTKWLVLVCYRFSWLLSNRPDLVLTRPFVLLGCWNWLSRQGAESQIHAEIKLEMKMSQVAWVRCTLLTQTSPCEYIKHIGYISISQNQVFRKCVALSVCVRFPALDSGGLVAKSCLTLAIPWTVAREAPLSMGFSRQDYWSGLTFPFPFHWRRKWQSTPVFLSGKSHGQRRLVGYSPWDCKSQTQLSNWAQHTAHIQR